MVVVVPPKEESKTVKRGAEFDNAVPGRKTLPECASIDSSVTDSTLRGDLWSIFTGENVCEATRF